MKPSITASQFNDLILRIESRVSTPFVCADGKSSDRLFTELFNVIEQFFNITEELN